MLNPPVIITIPGDLGLVGLRTTGNDRVFAKGLAEPFIDPDSGDLVIVAVDMVGTAHHIYADRITAIRPAVADAVGRLV